MSSRGDEPAFPRTWHEYEPGDSEPTEHSCPGMTLREWYIGMATAGMVALMPLDEQGPELIAECAARQADANIAELEKEHG